MPIDYHGALNLLNTTFAKAEAEVIAGKPPKVDEKIREAYEALFTSDTQAYRETLLGCLIARIQDKKVNIRLPYKKQGPIAFSGRNLDEKVINPFLQDKQIPSSRGPYLSVFRRSIQFDTSTRAGVRDKKGYDSFLAAISYIQSLSKNSKLLKNLHYLLYKFAELREKAQVSLSRLQRMSLEQYEFLISKLIETPSGGRFPVLLLVAAFTAIKKVFNTDWDIHWQGINVADMASGAVGDITITSASKILMACEVTERPMDSPRVSTIFNTKISPQGIEDYLFFVKPHAPVENAKQQARQYFAQGHEVNFIEIKVWILMTLATMGKSGRSVFNSELIYLLQKPEVPSVLKTTWNELIKGIATGQV